MNASKQKQTRRGFLKSSAAAAVVGGMAAGLAENVHAAGGDVLRVGLIGCGGRGTGAAVNALNADSNVKLVALGDVFADRLQTSLTNLKKDPEIAKKVEVKDDNCFIGFDAYQKVINSGVDVVILCT